MSSCGAEGIGGAGLPSSGNVLPAFGGGGLLSLCQDEKEEADLWLAVERHKADLMGGGRMENVASWRWITVCRAKEMANIWVKHLKVKNKCNLSHASAISFAADHGSVKTMCACIKEVLKVLSNSKL